MLIGVDADVLALGELAAKVVAAWPTLPDPGRPSSCRCARWSCPLALDHPLAHEAMARYQTVGARRTRPGVPDNVEFIRRVNDLASEARCSTSSRRRPTSSSGWATSTSARRSPCRSTRGTGWSPRSTTPPAPGRPQNAVGIGGIYLCVYGMEGPGGYQLVGRTVPVWRLRSRLGRKAVAAAAVRSAAVQAGDGRRARRAREPRWLQAQRFSRRGGQRCDSPICRMPALTTSPWPSQSGAGRHSPRNGRAGRSRRGSRRPTVTAQEAAWIRRLDDAEVAALTLDTRRPRHRRVPRYGEGGRTQRGGRTHHVRPSRPRARLLGR